MIRLRTRRAGFTLVELLVVIAIIVVLIAISLPVYSRAREKARQTTCMSNMHQIAMAVRMYRMDMGHYPGPYDPALGEGGLNALYPAYLDSRSALICPSDAIETGVQYVAQERRLFTASDAYETVTYEDLLLAASTMYSDIDVEYWVNMWQYGRANPPEEAPYDPSFFVNHYSSYNDLYNYYGYVGEANLYSLCDFGEQYLTKGDNLAFWYMYHRWDPGNELGVWTSPDAFGYIDANLGYHLAQQTYWWAYDPWNLDEGDRLQDSMRRPLWDPGNPDPTSYDYMPYGMPSPVFPGLLNRNAPDSTIITRCIHHRRYTIVRTPIKGTGGREMQGPQQETAIEYTESPKDIALRLDGSATMIVGLNYDWAVQPPYQQ